MHGGGGGGGAHVADEVAFVGGTVAWHVQQSHAGCRLWFVMSLKEHPFFSRRQAGTVTTYCTHTGDIHNTKILS